MPPRSAATPLASPDPRLWDPAGFPVQEGRASGPNGPVPIRLYGRPGRTPVIVLHGGPAAGARYMRPYAALARDRQVALYDQSGSYAAGRPGDLSRFTVARYVQELEAVRARLGFERVVLLGHSWGGLLAPAYAQAHPGRVAALVLAGSAPAWRGFQDQADRWLAELGPEAVATARRVRASHDTTDPAYVALVQRYYGLHLCRLQPWPEWFVREGERLVANPVYAYLNGPSEFDFTGALGPVDATAALRGLKAPTLITCGEFDEAPGPVARRIASLVRNAEVKVFAGLSHMNHIEDPVRVVSATAEFLARRA